MAHDKSGRKGFQIYGKEELDKLKPFVRLKNLDNQRVDTGIRYIRAVLRFLGASVAEQRIIHDREVAPLAVELGEFFTVGEIRDLNVFLRDKHTSFPTRMVEETERYLNKEGRDVRLAG